MSSDPLVHFTADMTNNNGTSIIILLPAPPEALNVAIKTCEDISCASLINDHKNEFGCDALPKFLGVNVPGGLKLTIMSRHEA